MVVIGNNTLVVTDEMGTIKLFNYPCDSGAGNGYMKCYSNHLNYIS